MGNNKGKPKQRKRGCEACNIARRKKGPVGGPIIKLKGNWTLNHYGGTDTFLGWLALQPTKHVEAWESFPAKTLGFLGSHIKRITSCLKGCWKNEYDKDPIKRVYVVCFSEYFLNCNPKHSPHLHFHLIPRTEKTAKCLTSLKWTHKVQDRCEIIPWRVNKIWRHEEFPEEYVVSPNRINPNVKRLMSDLQRALLKRVKSAKHS